MEKRKIMVVDDNITNLNVAKNALIQEYDVFLMPNGEQALKALEKIKPHLILLDVEMPDLNGFEVMKQIKEFGPPYNEIPVIFVTAKDDTSSELEGLNLGAVDYILKPFSLPLLIKRVGLHLKVAEQQQKLTHQQEELIAHQEQLEHYSQNLESMVSSQIETIQSLQYAIVHSLGNMVERRDGSTGAHLIRTSEYLKVLLINAKEKNIYDGQLNDAPIEEYASASKLHDVGKIAIPDGILLKDTKLTNYEYEIMKTHTLVGEEAISEAMDHVDNPAFLQVAANFIGAHHEKWDGTGYPRGLQGEEIPICGRLMAIADVYDALISPRTYKPALSHEETMKIMLDGDGTHFDPILMEIFREVHHEFEKISLEYIDHPIEPSSAIDVR